jgi:PHP family Zn ribbon phosphoesterase
VPRVCTTHDAQRTTRYTADLHIHTLLSPCAEIEMIPPLIVQAAQTAGLDIVGIADHNSCENAGAVVEAAKGSNVKVLPGLEVQSVEGVHLLCLFDTVEQAEAMQETVYRALQSVEVTERVYQQQMVVDSGAEFVNYCTRPIGLPTSLEIDEVFEKVCAFGGLLIPSHIDRLETGVCGVLGMLPESPAFEAVEVSQNLTTEQARARHPSIGSLPVFHSSDAHWLSAIGERRTVLHLRHRSVAEIRMACRSEGGRRVEDA